MPTRSASEDELTGLVLSQALAWDDEAPALETMLSWMEGAHVILLGEASHGTLEFYRTRAQITRALIDRGRCDAVLVEGDWPDAYRVHRFVQGLGNDRDAASALGDFQRFPQWMWRNTEVVAFVEWLRACNDARPATRRVAFHGMDLYSLYASMSEVIRYLETVDPDAARLARKQYGCFERFDNDPQAYGFSARGDEGCEEAATNQLLQLLARRNEYLSRDGILAQDEQFHAEQNARLVTNAERYYRGMFGSRVNTWNLRDRHMADTLEAILRHLGARRRRPHVVVWAHNSHLGDARATEMAARGELNLGQLARERLTGDVFSLGFTTHHGWVTAAHDWDESAERMRVVPALKGSYEALFHGTGLASFALNLRDPSLRTRLGKRLERAIGVIYRPATERQSHYLWSQLAAQFDAVLHFDGTSALEPLEPAATWHVPAPGQDTYPSGI